MISILIHHPFIIFKVSAFLTHKTNKPITV